MPSLKGRVAKAGVRGRPRTKPKNSKPSKWPHLTKEKQGVNPLDPQPGYAFLTLTVPQLALHAAQKGWRLLSDRASLFSAHKAADDAALEIQQNREAEEHHKQEKEQHQQRELEQKLLIARNIGFLTLRFGVSAWERSQIPLAQSWRDSQIIHTRTISEQKPQTEANVPSSSSDSLPTLSLSLYSTEPVCEQRKHELVHNSYSPPDSTDEGIKPTEHSNLEDPGPAFFKHTVVAAALSPPDSDYSPGTQEKLPCSQFDKPHPEESFIMSGELSVDAGGVDASIKDVIQNLFVMQQHVASFRPEIQDGLNRKVEDLAVSLQKLDDLVANPSNPIHSIKVAPDIIDYVDDGRNPDIYTRDFVELVQRGNAVLNGKQRAFRNFSKIFAQSLKNNFDGMDEEVDTIMENAGMEMKDGRFTEKQQNGSAT